MKRRAKSEERERHYESGELNNVSKPKKTDELPHDDSEKIPVGRIIRSKVQIISCVFFCLHDSNSIFLRAIIISELISGRTLPAHCVLPGHPRAFLLLHILDSPTC